MDRKQFIHVVYNLYEIGGSVGALENIVTLCKENPKGQHLLMFSPDQNSLEPYFELLQLAQSQDERVWSTLNRLLEREYERFAEFPISPALVSLIGDKFKVLEDMLRTLWVLEKSFPAMDHFIQTLPFTWLIPMAQEALSSAGFRVASFPGGIQSMETAIAKDNYRGIKDKISVHLTEDTDVLLIEGNRFSEGGRNLTDRSASTLAAAMDIDSLTLWNPSSFLMTSTQNYVATASIIDALSYAEFTELSYFGCSLVQPRDLLRAMKKKVPLYLRSFQNMNHLGTCISEVSTSSRERPAKGFSAVEHIALMNIEGAGMAGVPGVASKLFTALRQSELSVVFISQASSEHSICIAVAEEQWESAYDVIHTTFKDEMQRGLIEAVHVEPDCAIVAAVGSQMAGCPGIATRFFGSLSKANINVKAIAQGSSEQNISAVVGQQDVKAAIRALHSGFFLSNQTLSVGIIGPGLIGGTLLEQIGQEQDRLRKEIGIDIRIRGIMDTEKMLLSHSGIDCGDWKDEFQKSGVPTSVKDFIDHIDAHEFPHPVIIDCTSADAIAMSYLQWIQRGIHIITPNKKGGTSPLEYYKQLMESSRQKQKHFLYETTVGAGLPIIGTLKDLIQTGDRVKRIEGIFSGTLSYLFWRFNGEVPFSQLVLEAKELGFTEPDPRDDLSGMDIVRKTVILAREAGAEVELSEVDVASLVPESLRDIPLDQFLERMSEMDAPLQKLYDEAHAKGTRLRYVGTYDKRGGCSVALKQFPLDHPFSGTKGTDNIIAFTTERYNEQPLVIQGPGAGPEVTAGGIFADLLRLGSFLGPRL